jgi:hypothetical protein
MIGEVVPMVKSASTSATEATRTHAVQKTTPSQLMTHARQGNLRPVQTLSSHRHEKVTREPAARPAGEEPPASHHKNESTKDRPSLTRASGAGGSAAKPKALAGGHFTIPPKVQSPARLRGHRGRAPRKMETSLRHLGRAPDGGHKRRTAANASLVW